MAQIELFETILTITSAMALDLPIKRRLTAIRLTCFAGGYFFKLEN